MYDISQVIQKILFLDVECVCLEEKFEELSPRMQQLWTKKAEKFRNADNAHATAAELFFEKAAIQAEFGKIICISCGYIVMEEGQLKMKMKSFSHHDEYILLEEFSQMLNQWFDKSKQGRKVCTHNGREFDIPYIGRRMLINRMPLPAILNIQGKKSWNIDFILDTQELWRFGDNKAFTSLDLLAAIFNIPSPKDDIDGSQVSRVYWETKDLKRIQTYCEKDVMTTANVFLSMNGLPNISSEG
ncbi:MAG: ribonuclease H-like domain-containing protein [Bacteroidia bacterium]